MSEVLDIDDLHLVGREVVPLLLLRATEDRLVPRAAADAIARRAGCARIIDVVGPHLLLQAKAAECAEIIDGFMASLGGPARCDRPITLAMLDLYARYRGTTDFLRFASAADQWMSGDDWIRIDQLVQNIASTASGLAAREFIDDVERQVTFHAPEPEVSKQLWSIAAGPVNDADLGPSELR